MTVRVRPGGGIFRTLLVQNCVHVRVLSQSQNMRLFSRVPARPLGLKHRELCMEGQNGSVEKIQEEDLYRYTRHRWLFNEQRELAKRYLKFSLDGLANSAVNVCEGAQYCIRVTKCAEGLHNKAFLLTMDNGSEVFAKLPNPNAGPAHFTVASEVATRKMLRDVYSIPVPRILAWSSNAASTPVEAEYIIEEKAPGVRLGSVWSQWSRASKLQMITQVVEIESKLSSVTFDKHGCIYFTEDLRSLTGRQAGEISIHHDADPDVAPKSLKHFSIGPLTTSELWNGVRADMKLDRGPWRDSRDYTRALGRNEMAWIQAHAVPRMNYYRSSVKPEMPEDGIALLKKYMDVAPYLVPPSTDESAASASNVLWHPDLHLDNIFVDPDSHRITSIVDWQCASVAPLFYQSGVPRMCRHHGPVRPGWVIPERPDNFDELSEGEKHRTDADLESETLHKYYEAQVCKLSPRHWAVLKQMTSFNERVRKPVWLVSGVWENRDLFFLRDSLISLVAHWDELFPIPEKRTRSCPISFSESEIELHSKEEENITGVGQMLKLFRDQAILPVDGMVDPKDYETACRNMHKFREIFLSLAQDDAERDLFTHLWPYQDTES